MNGWRLPLKGEAGFADSRRMHLRLCTLAAATVAAGIAALPGSAAPGAATFALIPEHYDPSLHASKSYFVAVGRVYTNSVRVSNLGTQTGTALLYPVDATTGQTSGAVYLDRSKPRRGVGAWVTLGARSVTLAPGQSKEVPVTVRVPASALPGDHLGGIVAENLALTAPSGKGSLQIKIRHLTIAAVLVQVTGDARARMEIGGVRPGGGHGYQYVYVRLANAGRVATKPSLRLVITRAGGGVVASRTLKLDTFLPRTGIDYPALLPNRALQPGRYRADVRLTYAAAAIGYRRVAGPSQTISRSFAFTISRQQYTTVFAGVRPLTVPSEPPAAPSGGNVTILALAGGLAGLLIVLVAAVFGVRRWMLRA